MDEVRKWHQEKLLLKVVDALKRRDFDAHYFAGIDEVNEFLLKEIPSSASIGIGGSVTIRELGIIEKFEQRNNIVIHHWRAGLTEQTDREIRKRELLADYYLTSANAITKSGDIINIDGIGNRISGMIYGPENVFIVAGYNKIVGSIHDGIKRSKEIAAVMNAKRVSAHTPCVGTGVCIDCNVKGRICRVISIIQYRPWQTKISVLLVNERLGF
uniref:Lactate utilization protein n=1 Tax=candidate division WOR-3 bacterium TaxID=2052148 RepID=A0A7C4XE93_UNCW3